MNWLYILIPHPTLVPLLLPHKRHISLYTTGQADWQSGCWHSEVERQERVRTDRTDVQRGLKDLYHRTFHSPQAPSGQHSIHFFRDALKCFFLEITTWTFCTPLPSL
jgi:hypothetical protein